MQHILCVIQFNIKIFFNSLNLHGSLQDTLEPNKKTFIIYCLWNLISLQVCVTPFLNPTQNKEGILSVAMVNKIYWNNLLLSVTKGIIDLYTQQINQPCVVEFSSQKNTLDILFLKDWLSFTALGHPFSPFSKLPDRTDLGFFPRVYLSSVHFLINCSSKWF